VDIDKERQDRIKRHAEIPNRGVPGAVVLAIAAVVGDGEIAAAWTDWDTTTDTQATTWTCWVVTERTVGHVRVIYQNALYDEHAERQHKLTPSEQSAWVRPLTDVTKLQWGAFCEAQEKDNAYYPADPITVTFTDGEATIPKKRELPVDQRSKADRFLTALRKGTHL
jgi:hypothetical protein